eukprot:NODE_521_length_900_cov_575.698002_g397_i0.p1 GENE.NODE_521_length_900_cov_575.698002_g397_i0~~NODE_521_length_900_cov_575.698002_g397_i0.p1  ORF type:complete len:282 (+),score=56.74 NODE_521_length_900_cov_575.698002_g397_i0:25-846(+)
MGCVMDNVFRTQKPVHEIYDLKGSWVDRSADCVHTTTEAQDDPELGDTAPCSDRAEETVPLTAFPTEPGSPVFSLSAIGVLKDNDLTKRLFVTEEHRMQLVAQARKDCAFLCRNGLTDYSFLVGVHRAPFETLLNYPLGTDMALLRGLRRTQRCPPSHLDSFRIVQDTPQHEYVPFHRRDQGGIMSGHVYARHTGCTTAEDVFNGDGLYFFGIVDTAQSFGCCKILERYWKTCVLCKDAAGVSAMRPSDYASRFERRCVSDRFVAVPLESGGR